MKWLLVIVLVVHLSIACFPDRDSFGLYTPDNDTYNYFIKVNYNFFTFKVDAKNDATIALFSEDIPSNPTYEIIIGLSENTKTVIKKNGEEKSSKSGAILSDGNYIEMWCRFSKNIVSIGFISQESEPYVAFEDSELGEISYISLITTNGATGKWVVSIPKYGWQGVFGPVRRNDTCQ